MVMPSPRRRRHFGILSTGLLLLLATACAPNPPLYVPLQAGGDHGYTEVRVSPTRYQVTFKAPVAIYPALNKSAARSHAEHRTTLAYDMAMWRAAELALENGFPAFKITDRSNDVSTDYRYGTYGAPFYPPCYDPRFGPDGPCPSFGFSSPSAFDRYAWIEAGVTLTVEFESAIRPGLFDAREAVDKLRAQYPTAREAGQPLG
jgi:hypothetical protein